MSAGKGSSPRSCFSKTYRENFDAIFKKAGAVEIDPDADLTEEIKRIIREEPADADRHQKLMGLSFSKAGRMLARQKGTRTVDPHP